MRRVYLCPVCAGRGHMANGGGSWSPGRVVVHEPATCHLCNGSGRVYCQPAPKGVSQAYTPRDDQYEWRDSRLYRKPKEDT